MKKKTGIWIDKRTAKIVSFINSEEDFQTINSAIGEYKPKGGSGTRLKGGPQDVVQDSKYIEREKHQHKKYFRSILDSISDSDHIVIFGPALMGKKLYSELSESNPIVCKKVTEVKSADSMTDNQVIAWVRNYYNL